jgi:exosortase/archaeosortase family protein
MLRSAQILLRPGMTRVEPWVFAAVLLSLYGGLQLLFEAPFPALQVTALSVATAEVAVGLLAALDVTLARQGLLLLHAEGFVTEVHATCTALVPATLLAAAVALHHGPRPGQKIAGMLGAVVLVVLVNQVRLVGVIWLGVNAPALFPLVHGWLAPIALIVFGAAYWLAWVRWTMRQAHPHKAVPIPTRS